MLTILTQSFCEDLILLLVDNILIGTVVLILGFFANKKLDEYRIKKTYQAEVAKQQLAKVGEAWEFAYLFEHTTISYVREACNILINTEEGYTDKDKYKIILEPIHEKACIQSTEFTEFVEKNRFWLGEKLRLLFMDFHNAVLNYREAVEKNDFDALKKAEKMIEAMRDDLQAQKLFSL